MEQVLIFATILSPIIVALMEVVKRTVVVKNNFLPLIALVLGVLVGFIAQPFTDLDVVYRLWAGGFAGLAATGLYEFGVKRSGTTPGTMTDGK